METRLGGDMFCVHTEVAMQHCGDEALLFQLKMHCPAQNAVLQIQCKHQQAAKQGSQVLCKVQGPSTAAVLHFGIWRALLQGYPLR